MHTEAYRYLHQNLGYIVLSVGLLIVVDTLVTAEFVCYRIGLEYQISKERNHTGCMKSKLMAIFQELITLSMGRYRGIYHSVVVAGCQDTTPTLKPVVRSGIGVFILVISILSSARMVLLSIKPFGSATGGQKCVVKIQNGNTRITKNSTILQQRKRPFDIRPIGFVIKHSTNMSMVDGLMSNHQSNQFTIK